VRISSIALLLGISLTAEPRLAGLRQYNVSNLENLPGGAQFRRIDDPICPDGQLRIQ